jgi:hypothetical protein
MEIQHSLLTPTTDSIRKMPNQLKVDPDQLQVKGWFHTNTADRTDFKASF